MNRNISFLLIAAGSLVSILVMCVCFTTGLGLFAFLSVRDLPPEQFTLSDVSTATSTPLVIRPTDQAPPATPAGPAANAHSQIYAVEDLDTLTILRDTIVPVNDPLDLAARLQGRAGLARTIDLPESFYEVGDQQTFWVLNTDDNRNYQVKSTLQYVTDHLYLWIQDGVNYNEAELEDLAETFEKEIYPTNRTYFGSEWSPGVDGDPHLYVLYARGLGGNVAGYFSPGDEYPPEVKKFSNGHEMFLMSADKLDLDTDFTFGVLAHEFQHMIHWYLDPNEEAWVTEGFSELAAFLNRYGTGRVEYAFIADPDIQLTTWPDDQTATHAHYGASFLFMTYFLDRFGESTTRALVANPDNGMASIDRVLVEENIQAPDSSKLLFADDVFADWAVTNYLNDPSVADGQYSYNFFSDAPQANETETISECPTGLFIRDVSQYGADYIRIDCEGDFVINFEGSLQAEVLPADPHSGSHFFYSNRGDSSNMTLTKSFDFRDESGPLTLSYWTWYDIEQDYDYLYLTASTDGENWEILTTPSGTDLDPSGSSYGWGYNGKSSDGPVWIKETVDISQYAGQQVQLRFEYITDAAVNGEGFLLDDISVPETGYFSDFESDDGGWEANGFARIRNILPQTFRLSLIKLGDENQVEHIPLSADNSASIPVSIGREFDEVVLVVSGTAPFTLQKAAYQLQIQP